MMAYVSGVALIMRNGERIFGDKPDNFWSPVLFLMLFVLSAAVTGALVLGRPILLYWDGAKKEALTFFGYTLGWLFILILVAFVLFATQS